MNIIQKLQEKYIQEFSATVPIDEFILNLIIISVLVTILRWFYIRYGNSISNRQKFANNFLPLAMGTVLIIMVVKSSIALSLGLVGALSIVRFRAAIKEPEELVYLFIVIGLGLAGGANQPILAIVAFVLILGILFLNKIFIKKQDFKKDDKMFVNITTDLTDLKEISNTITELFPYVELKRLDTLENGLDITYLCKANDIDQINNAQQSISKLSPKTRLSIIEQPEW